VISFLHNRTTILIMNRKMIKSFSIRITTFQKFSLFFIFYLFYNANLLKLCDKLEINTKLLKYANDANILIYDKNTNKNCRNLKLIHKCVRNKSIWHKFVFVLTKYKLIHFIKNFKKFNMTITIKIKSNII
jgi:hypothetical protein